MGFSPGFAVVGAFGSAPLPPFGGADATLPAPLGRKGGSYSTLALGTAECLLLSDLFAQQVRLKCEPKGGNFSVQSVTHKKDCQRGIIQRDPHPFHSIRFSLFLQIVD